MSEQHTPGRLIVRGGFSLYAEDGKTPVADACLNNSVAAHDEANARRIAACWNFCIDEDTALIEAIERQGDSLRKRHDAALTLKEQYQRELCSVEQQRDELRALLKEARKIVRASSSRVLAKDWDQRATTAIAKTLGSAT